MVTGMASTRLFVIGASACVYLYGTVMLYTKLKSPNNLAQPSVIV